MKRIIPLLITLLFFQLTSIAQPCLPDGITFTTQAQIDSFQTDYPNCTEIEGNVLISSDSISNLNGLNVLTSINGNFQIGELYVGVPLLENLTGLNNLSVIAGDFQISSNDSLESLEGLDNLVSVGGDFKIDRNDALINLVGLETLLYVGGKLSFYQNDDMGNFQGLESLSYVGGLSIDGNENLTYLTGFENLTYIDGSLDIYNSFDLINLSGLNNITRIKNSVSIVNNWEFSSFTGLENLDSIGGILDIHENDELIDFSGLNSLTYIGGLFLFGNYSIVDFTGLENLTSINGLLQASWNESLENFSGLNGVTVIDGDIVIYYNYSLSSLEGLENIGAYSIDNLWLSNNSSLSNCNVESICNYLVSPNGTVSIFKNAISCNNPAEIAEDCGITMDCLPFGNYYFHSQKEIDSFKDDFPNCSELKGNVQISGEDINDLTGLSDVISIEGNLAVYRNSLLIDFTGLNSLNLIGNDFFIGGYEGRGNPLLINFSGLENLQNVGDRINIYFNDNLENFSGLGGLTSIIKLEILGNKDLISLTGLENLDTIPGSLYVRSNSNLTDLGNLGNLVYVGDNIAITNNDSLKSLSGLDNINAESINHLEIIGNTSLSECHIESICDFLILPDAWVSIENNASGCNTAEEVEEACLVNVNEVNQYQNIITYPNPITTSTTIEYELMQSEFVTLSVYNYLGERIDIIQRKQSAGKQQMVWDAKDLPAGFYFCTIQSDGFIGTVKLIKQ